MEPAFYCTRTDFPSNLSLLFYSGFLEQPVTINVPNETCDQIVGNVPVEKPKCLRHLTNDVSCKVNEKL